MLIPLFQHYLVVISDIFGTKYYYLLRTYV